MGLAGVHRLGVITRPFLLQLIAAATAAAAAAEEDSPPFGDASIILLLLLTPPLPSCLCSAIDPGDCGRRGAVAAARGGDDVGRDTYPFFRFPLLWGEAPADESRPV